MKARKKSVKKKSNNNFKFELTGIALITLAALGTASMFTNALGTVGSMLVRAMEILAGENKYLVVLSLTLVGIKFISEKSKVQYPGPYFAPGLFCPEGCQQSQLGKRVTGN